MLSINENLKYPKRSNLYGNYSKRIAQLEEQNTQLQAEIRALTKKFDLVFDQKYTAYSLDTITMSACDFFKVEIYQLKAKTRKREIVQARQACMQIAYRKSKLSLKQIGDYFNRDHSTVIHSLNVIESDYLTGKDEKSIEFLYMYMPFENFLEELDIFYRKHYDFKD